MRALPNSSFSFPWQQALIDHQVMVVLPVLLLPFVFEYQPESVTKRFVSHHSKFPMPARLSLPQKNKAHRAAPHDGRATPRSPRVRPLTLRQRLHPDGLVVREPVVLRLHPRVVDQRPRVGDQAAHRRTDVDVDLGDSRFSTARTEPCLVWRPMAVEPNLMAWRGAGGGNALCGIRDARATDGAGAATDARRGHELRQRRLGNRFDGLHAPLSHTRPERDGPRERRC